MDEEDREDGPNIAHLQQVFVVAAEMIRIWIETEAEVKGKSKKVFPYVILI